MSETATCRERLIQFTIGNGLDIGAGGDAITPTAICIDRAENDGSRAHVGSSPTHLIGDAADLRWFRDASLDYVYSSHVLEDFVDTRAALREWLRVIRPGGHLVLFLPDQQRYLAYCASCSSLPNQAHKHPDFGLVFVLARLAELGYTMRDVAHVLDFAPNNPYSFDLVIRKH